jgi:putative RecB family exonuclease
MSEYKEIEAELGMSSKVLEAQKTISPSSINTFYNCPRSYFYNYIAKVRVKPNLHLIKGSIVHEALENFFKFFVEEFTLNMNKCYEDAMKRHEKEIANLELNDDELKIFKADIEFMLNEYLVTFSRKVDALIKSEKAENKSHAWFLLRPKFREKYVKDEELHCCGYIDRISEDYNGVVTIGDYKTSSKFGIGLPEDYKRQLALYSLLYQNQEKITPHFAGVIFLRYGEEYLVEVTPSLLRYAQDTISFAYESTRSTAIKDYPLKEGSLCRWCQYRDICSGKEDWKAIVRKQRLEKFIKKEVEDDVSKKSEKG